MKKFPTKIYVKVERDGDADWLLADVNLESLVDPAAKIKIATYVLDVIDEVKMTVSTERTTNAKV